MNQTEVIGYSTAELVEAMGKRGAATLPGFSTYRILENGEVVSLRDGKPRILTGSSDNRGYRKFTLVDDLGRKHSMRRAVMVCTAFHGPRPDGMIVCHADGSLQNDSKANLSWSTSSENILNKRDNKTVQSEYRSKNSILNHSAELAGESTEIFTKNGIRILVDRQDFESLVKFSWGVIRSGYARRGFRKDGKLHGILMHRQILGMSPDDKREVDHINSNRLDNRRSNLRICSGAENRLNRLMCARNTSGFKGVQWHRQTKKWVARISRGRRNIHLGLFETAELAHEVYCLAADMLHGEFANYGARRDT